MFDLQMRLAKPPLDSMVSVVCINDLDYRKLFDGTSPLNCKMLSSLIDAIAKGEPLLIGVDIDTSARSFLSEFQPGTDWPYIVWEREPRTVPQDAASPVDPLDALGGRTDLDYSKNALGFALLIEDSEDGVTRRYRRLIPTTVGPLPSFPWAVVKVYQALAHVQSTGMPETLDEYLIRYSGDQKGSHRVNLSASTVMDLASRWPQSSPIRGRIVLLGGSYLDQDRHATPLGRLSGVEVLANTIETELLPDGPHKAPRKAVVFLWQFLEGFAFVVLFHSWPRWAFLVSLGAVPFLSAISSFCAFGTWSDLWHFAPVLVLLVLWESLQHLQRNTIPRKLAQPRK